MRNFLRRTKDRRPILALDFDGCLHGYESGWKGAANIPDPPVDGAGLYLLRAIPHFRVAIFSSRSRSPLGRLAMKRYVLAMLWTSCMEDTDAYVAAWHAISGYPPDWLPWTVYDCRDGAEHIAKAILWPWFKPAALMTIDDRALTFNGDWSHPDYQPEAIRKFRPWNKRPTLAATPGEIA